MAEHALTPPGSMFRVSVVEDDTERWVYRSRLMGSTLFVAAAVVLWIGIDVAVTIFGGFGLSETLLLAFMVVNAGVVARFAWICWDDTVVLTVHHQDRTASIWKRTFLHTWRLSLSLDEVAVSVCALRTARQLFAQEWVVVDLGPPGWVVLGRVRTTRGNRELAAELAARWMVKVHESDGVRIGGDHTCCLFPSMM